MSSAERADRASGHGGSSQELQRIAASDVERLRAEELALARAFPRKQSSFVYFVECKGAKAIKIGKTNDPRGRLEALQTGCPLKLNYIVRIFGGVEEEYLLHRKFAHLRIHGEWFRAEDELVDFVLGLTEDEEPDYDELLMRFGRVRAARIAAEQAAAE